MVELQLRLCLILKPEPSLWVSKMGEERGGGLGNFEHCFQKDLLKQKLLASYVFMSGLAQDLDKLRFQIKGLTQYLC